MIRIAHVGAFNGRNWGDRCIQRGMHDLFDRYADIEWWTIDCQSTLFTTALIDRINANADLLLVGGGGLIWDWPGS